MDAQHFSTMLMRKWNQERDAMLAPQDLGCFNKAALIFGEVSPWLIRCHHPRGWGPWGPRKRWLAFSWCKEKWLKQRWFMVDITNVRIHGDYFMVYKPTYNWGSGLTMVYGRYNEGSYSWGLFHGL